MLAARRRTLRRASTEVRSWSCATLSTPQAYTHEAHPNANGEGADVRGDVARDLCGGHARADDQDVLAFHARRVSVIARVVNLARELVRPSRQARDVGRVRRVVAPSRDEHGVKRLRPVVGTDRRWALPLQAAQCQRPLRGALRLVQPLDARGVRGNVACFLVVGVQALVGRVLANMAPDLLVGQDPSLRYVSTAPRLALLNDVHGPVDS